MDLLLSKLLPLFVYPLGLTLVLTVAATLLLLWGRRTGYALLILAVALLWSASTPMLSDFIRSTLEWTYLPVPVENSPSAGAIVVLGGAAGGPERPGIEINLWDAADRVRHAARLYKAGKAPIIVVSGGLLPWEGEAPPEAEVLRTLLMEWGVPGSAILTETGSRNTWENAANTRRLLSEAGVKSALLVTSAIHMRRAQATFETAGVSTIPSPTDYSVAYARGFSILNVLPSAGALSRTTDALKEYLGYGYYRSRGWIR